MTTDYARLSASPQDRAQVKAWAERFDWEAWEALIRERGVTVDRPRQSVHPVHQSIVYPIDYGYVNETVSTDGDGIDVFVGTSDTGLVGAVWTTDRRKGDRECKFLLDCSPEEIYLVNGFLNFDQSLMEGVLAMREPMDRLWRRDEPYVPIDCGFYDRLEAWAVRSTVCEIELEDGTTFEGRFVDFHNRPDGEFGVLEDGSRLRLDTLARVNGIARPGSSCDVSPVS